MRRHTVSLPMYDADRVAVQAWWRVLAAAIEAEGIEGAPPALDWPADLDAHWRDPQLLLSQTCGYPLVTGLRGVVQLVGAFRYTAPGCAGIAYRSELVVRGVEAGGSLADFRGRVAAINDPGSHSGCNALRGLVAPLAHDGRFFRQWVVSGSHRRSLEWVRSGRADIAAIDCVTLAGLLRLRPDLLDGLRIVGSTPLAPGLPLVTAAATSAADLARLRRALSNACADPSCAPLREALFIDGFDVAEAALWQPIDDVRALATLLH